MSHHRRVLLKLSGEALAGEKKTGFDEETVKKVAAQVKKAAEEGTELCLVIGGGNFWRGRSSKSIDRTKADAIGMLATVMNCLYVSEIFRSEGMQTEIYTPFVCGSVTKLYSKDEADADMKAGKILFFAGGLGHPYFSTDTICVLRALELECDGILLAKSIDGVYDSDPGKNPDAKKYDTISVAELVSKDLKVIDGTAAALCRDYPVPMQIFDLAAEDSIYHAMHGDAKGTRITV